MKSFLTTCTLLLCFCLLTSCKHTVQKVYLADDVHLADKYFERGQYGEAVVNYQQLIADYPESRTRQRMMVQQAESYSRLKQNPALTDAYWAYTGYLKQYPDGYYREEAEEGIENIRIVQANRKRTIRETYDKLGEDVDQLRGALEDNPYDAQLWLKLGNAQWGLERYDEAAEAYAEAIKIDVALKEHELIQSRVDVTSQGQTRAITPEEQAYQERQRNPLVVTISNEYKARPRNTFMSGSENLYVVTGLVHNQSTRQLNNVVVEMYFLNVVDEILDVQKEYVGNLPPGAVRGFMLKGSTFDNIFNIGKVEYQAYEQR